MELPFDVVDLGPCDPPAVGDQAPDFERPLVTQEHWRDTSLDELVATGPVLLVFHPMLGSFPATYVWSAIAERELSDRYDVAIVGVTSSTPYAARRFLEERSVDGRLVSDPANTVAAAWDLDHDLDGMAGVSEPRLAVFVLDADRTVRYAWTAAEWPEFPDYDDLEAALADIA